MADDFEQRITAACMTGSPSLEFGAVVQGATTYPGLVVRLALEMVHRHALVAGATGTARRRPSRLLTEELSDARVPDFLVDIKGDISGLGAPAAVNDYITSRPSQIGVANGTPPPPDGASGAEYGTGSGGRSSGGGSPAAKQAGNFDLDDAAKLGARVLTSSTTNKLGRFLFGILSGRKR